MACRIIVSTCKPNETECSLEPLLSTPKLSSSCICKTLYLSTLDLRTFRYLK